VPRTRNVIEVCQFIILLIFYVATLIRRNDADFTPIEAIFCVYSLGWVLDGLASVLEHGWHVHTQNLWAFLDVTFMAIYTVYFALRMYGLAADDPDYGRQALDILSIAAPVLLPRLAFNLMPENMLFLSLRAMMGDFLMLTLLAVWCFGGFLLSMKWLSRWNAPNAHTPAPDSLTISKWMLWIWFGLDGTGIQHSPDFHRILGPTMMILFAFLGNTLFLTILVSMLSNTFSNIVSDATAEIQFRRAVLTFEGVKSDAIFAYPPPFNVLALIVLLPLKSFLSARWFHKVNITAVRILNAPILLSIGLYERRYLWKSRRKSAPRGPSKHRKAGWFNWSRFSPHGDIQAVFDVEPPQSFIEEIEAGDDLDTDALTLGFISEGRGGGMSDAGDRSVSPGRQRFRSRSRRVSTWN